MPKAKVKTFEDWVDYYYRKYLDLAQYRKALAADPPTVTHQQLRDKATARAAQRERDQLALAHVSDAKQLEDLRSDAEFRDERISEYEGAYGEWDDAGDRALLINLVELETQHRVILRDLTKATFVGDKVKYWSALKENAEAQKSLQVTLGIDKKSRETARQSGNPIDNWAEIKDELADWVDQLIAEFPAEADAANTIEELRDLMKYKFSLPFDIIDSVLYNVRRLYSIEEAIS